MTNAQTTALRRQQINHILLANVDLLDSVLRLELGPCEIEVRSNHPSVLETLRHYFRHLVNSNTPGEAQTVISVLALQQPETRLDLHYQDWVREAGKSGRKDSYFDCDNGRVIHKVRTGMLFLQQEGDRIASGDCIKNDNQVINFINAQYMNWLQQRDWLICHAAAIEHHGNAIAIAAFSGGGKSTTMLRLMDLAGSDFVSNDRLFIRRESNEQDIQVAGVPKLPRINPGTIVHNPKLQNILSPERRQQLLSMESEALWQLEEKYDVDILQCYGADRICHQAKLDTLLILNWERTASPLAVTQVNLDQRRDLLQALMKSPGPFYQKAGGEFHRDTTPLDEQAYLDILETAQVFEVSGGVDFDGLVNWCNKRLTDDPEND